MMTSEEQIAEIYRALRAELPPGLAARVKFLEPDFPDKHGAKKWRGRITSSKPGTIFDPSWCFFEVGIGRYAADEPNCGGVGLVCFVDNKKCGSGLHSAAVSSLASRFSAANPRFVASPRGSKNQGVFVYYPGISFPLRRAVDDLKLLLVSCLDFLESLRVERSGKRR
jgi:hypothetical protein